MKHNAYGNVTFFEGYRHLRVSGSGLNDALEQPAITPVKGCEAGHGGCRAGAEQEGGSSRRPWLDVPGHDQN